MKTIYALSSGALPAAIAVVRISGPAAVAALERLCGRVPNPRRASLVRLTDPRTGELLDEAICLRFAAPRSVTGEDLVELHLHGGRAVVAGVLDALSSVDGLREAQPGEFTRRSFLAGRIDLTAVEGLSDLLEAETADQRRQALRLAEGGLSRLVEETRLRLLRLAAKIEAAIDYAEEGDETATDEEGLRMELDAVAQELRTWLNAPPAERLRDGIRVVLAGPPNAGKSTLLNALVGRSAALVSALPGTTRDRIEVPVVLSGIPFIFVDTAGLRETKDEVETLGIALARTSIEDADILLWLGEPSQVPRSICSLVIAAKSDLGRMDRAGTISVSALSGAGLALLRDRIVAFAKKLLPAPGAITLNVRQRNVLGQCASHLARAGEEDDIILVAEAVRLALGDIDRLTGRAGVDEMLTELFSRFCLGK